MYFRRVALALCGSLMMFMLVCMLFRLFNGKSAFVGLSRLYQIIQGLDFWHPFVEMYDVCSDIVMTFNKALLTFNNISNVGDFFNAFGNFFTNLLNMISVPFRVIYYILYFFFNVGYQIAQFMRMVLVD